MEEENDNCTEMGWSCHVDTLWPHEWVCSHSSSENFQSLCMENSHGQSFPTVCLQNFSEGPVIYVILYCFQKARSMTGIALILHQPVSVLTVRKKTLIVPKPNKWWKKD